MNEVRRVYLLLLKQQGLYPTMMDKVDQTDGAIRRCGDGFTVEPDGEQFGWWIPDSAIREVKYYRTPPPPAEPEPAPPVPKPDPPPKKKRRSRKTK